MKKISFVLLLFCAIPIYSQEEDIKSKSAQVSFIYPIGSDWVRSIDYSYNFSLNVLAGVTGGVDGLEMAGIINVNTGEISGVQLAGIGNFCHSEANDIVQISGITNIDNGNLSGFQAAGIFNGVNGSVNGVQIAGIGNLNQNMDGAQLAGICNISSGAIDGVQAAGISNLAGSGSKVFQIAGITNIVNEESPGQISGIANFAGNTSLQIAGIGNTGKDIDGIQIGGIFNIAGTVDGMQLAGILNICDSIDGVPLALVSIVRKNGYRRFDIWHSELTGANISFKTGVRRLYTMFSLGYNFNSDYNIYFGAGIGTSMKLTRRNYLDIEYHIAQATENWTIRETNLWNQLRFNLTYQMGERFAIYGGPTVNMLISEKSQTSKPIAPGWARKFKYNKKLTGWFGYNVGLRF